MSRAPGFRAARTCLLLVVVAGCARAERASAPLHGPLPPGVAARVGGDSVALETVRRISKAQRVAPNVARERAVSDALFARGARASFGASGLLPVVERAVLARAVLEQIKADAQRRGPPSDAEVEVLTAERWQDFDRPETTRVTHAVARVRDAKDATAARALAERIHDAVRGIVDPAEFMRVAQAQAHDASIELRAERLPPMTPDGRGYDPDAREPISTSFDPVFAKAASELAVGSISTPLKTQFGYHVILCEARLPAKHVPLEERRRLFADEVVKRRAEHAKNVLLARLAGPVPVSFERSIDALTALVPVSQ